MIDHIHRHSKTINSRSKETLSDKTIRCPEISENWGLVVLTKSLILSVTLIRLIPSFTSIGLISSRVNVKRKDKLSKGLECRSVRMLFSYTGIKCILSRSIHKYGIVNIWVKWIVTLMFLCDLCSMKSNVLLKIFFSKSINRNPAERVWHCPTKRVCTLMHNSPYLLNTLKVNITDSRFVAWLGLQLPSPCSAR